MITRYLTNSALSEIRLANSETHFGAHNAIRRKKRNTANSGLTKVAHKTLLGAFILWMFHIAFLRDTFKLSFSMLCKCNRLRIFSSRKLLWVSAVRI